MNRAKFSFLPFFFLILLPKANAITFWIAPLNSDPPICQLPLCMGLSPLGPFDNLQYALDAYLLADQLIDYLRRNFEAEGSKLNFAQYAAKVYAQALNTTIALHQRQHPTALDSAFMFSEKAKLWFYRKK